MENYCTPLPHTRTGEDVDALAFGNALHHQVGGCGVGHLAPLQHLFQDLLLGVQRPLCSTETGDSHGQQVRRAAQVIDTATGEKSSAGDSPSCPSSTASNAIHMCLSPAGTFLMKRTWLVSSSAHMVGDTCRSKVTQLPRCSRTRVTERKRERPSE